MFPILTSCVWKAVGSAECFLRTALLEWFSVCIPKASFIYKENTLNLKSTKLEIKTSRYCQHIQMSFLGRMMDGFSQQTLVLRSSDTELLFFLYRQHRPWGVLGRNNFKKIVNLNIAPLLESHLSHLLTLWHPPQAVFVSWRFQSQSRWAIDASALLIAIVQDCSDLPPLCGHICSLNHPISSNGLILVSLTQTWGWSFSFCPVLFPESHALACTDGCPWRQASSVS